MTLAAGIGKLTTRMRVQGIWHTAGYLLFTVLLERLGVSLQYAFEAPASLPSGGPAPGACTAGAVQRMSDLRASDVDSLRRYGGAAMIGDFERRLGRGEVCIVSRTPESAFACAAWLKPAAARHQLASAPDAMRFESCFTVPEQRGKGAFSTALSYGQSWLRARSASAAPLFIECSVFNTSSERAILKAGFRKTAMLLFLGKRSLVLHRAR